MLLKAVKSALNQVVEVIECAKELPSFKGGELYQSKGVGRHVRHIVDHFLALHNGLELKVVDYNQRNRESPIEVDYQLAHEKIQFLMNWLDTLELNQQRLEVYSEIDCFQTVTQSFESCLERELLYLINHTIHHMAYVKLVARVSGVFLPEHIGIAPSTATFLRESSADVHA